MFDNNLKEAREEAGLSQAELSYLTEINPSTISGIERGVQYPFAGYRSRLAEALEVDQEELFPGFDE